MFLPFTFVLLGPFGDILPCQ